VIALLRSLRSLILGETWTIPLGVATAVVVAVLFRSAIADHLWDEIGGFVLAAMIAATLAISLARSR
jgi:hypothetical protein